LRSLTLWRGARDGSVAPRAAKFSNRARNTISLALKNYYIFLQNGACRSDYAFLAASYPRYSVNSLPGEGR
jgi:hypothetical protein